jgi:site-specific DNA-methyltransferase (adenine-specific)
MLELNEIYNMDCLDGLKKMIEQKIVPDCVITDPPYCINYQPSYGPLMKDKLTYGILNDKNDQLIIDVMPLLYEVMRQDSALYMFASMKTIDLFKREVSKYFTIRNIIIWDKGHSAPGDTVNAYRNQYELIIYATKGVCPFVPGAYRHHDIWAENRLVDPNRYHIFQKPLPLLTKMMLQHTYEGNLILDPFMGSASTAEAAYRFKRKYIGFELDKEYFDIAVDRLNKVKAQPSFFEIAHQQPIRDDAIRHSFVRPKEKDKQALEARLKTAFQELLD